MRTYHVSPKGSSLIENLRWRDEKEIPMSILYALVIDGDFFYPNRALPSITSVPTQVLVDAQACFEEKLCVIFRREFGIRESMLFVEMFSPIQAACRARDLEMFAELTGYWRLAAADERHRRDLIVQHLRDRAREGQLDRLYPSEVEALLKDIPISFKDHVGVAKFVRAKYDFLPEELVQQLAAEYLTRQKRSEQDGFK